MRIGKTIKLGQDGPVSAVNVDNRTTVLNQAKEITAFHDFNQGEGFEFPSGIKLNLDTTNSPDLKIEWLGTNGGVDVFKYEGVEYKLGLMGNYISSDQVKTNCVTFGFTHYMCLSSHLGFTYWKPNYSFSKELPILNKFEYNGKDYLPIAVIKFVFNPDYSINLKETQVSRIYEKGQQVKEAQAITVSTIMDRDNLTPTLNNGDIVKVLDAGRDRDNDFEPHTWACYRYKSDMNGFEVVSSEVPPSVYPDFKTIEFRSPVREGDMGLQVPSVQKTMVNSIEILEDFDFDVTYNKGTTNENCSITLKPRGIGSRQSLPIPIKTKTGNKFLLLGEVTFKAPEGSYNSWDRVSFFGLLAKISETDADQTAGMAYNTGSKGYPVTYLQEDESSWRLPILMVKAKLPYMGYDWDETKVFFHKYWKNNLNVTPETILPNQTFSNFFMMSSGTRSIQDGEIVKVLDASADPNVSKGWAWYRFIEATSVFQLVSKQFAELSEQPALTLPNQYFQDIAERNNNQDNVADGEFVKVIDASAEKDIEVGYAWYRYTKQYKLWERVSTQFDNSRIVADIATRDTTSYTKNLKHGELVKVIDASADPNVSKGWAWYRYAKQSQLFDLVSKQYFESVSPETPSLQEVTDKGHTTTNRMVQKVNGVNSFGHAIEDETGSAKHSQNILNYAGHYELAGKDKSIGISLNGEGEGYFKKGVSVAGLKVRTGAAAGKVALCNDAVGNVTWGDMPRVYSDGYSIEEYDLNNGERPTFAVMDSMRTFRHDQILLADFDFKIGYADYSDSFIFTPIGVKNGHVPIKINGVDKFLSIQSVGMKRNLLPADATYAYLSVSATVVDTIDEVSGMGVGYAPSIMQVRPHSDSFNSNIELFQVRVKIPSLGGNIEQKEIYVSKYWKQALAPLGDLMDYRIANP